jgi:transcriptional regulator with XRE-family HTH domain
MRIQSIADLGAAIKERRIQLGMDQAALAKAAGTSRKWLVEAEKGKARAEVGLILKTLKALGMKLELNLENPPLPPNMAVAAKAIETLLGTLKKKP